MSQFRSLATILRYAHQNTERVATYLRLPCATQESVLQIQISRDEFWEFSLCDELHEDVCCDLDARREVAVARHVTGEVLRTVEESRHKIGDELTCDWSVVVFQKSSMTDPLPYLGERMKQSYFKGIG